MARKKRTSEERALDDAADVVPAEEATTEAVPAADRAEVPAPEAAPKHDAQADVKPKMVRVTVTVGLFSYQGRFYARGDTVQLPEPLAAYHQSLNHVRY